MKYKHVIWDWNGTLLNDVELGHSLLNLLQEMKQTELSSFDEYRKIFTFPITDFYKKAGIFKDMEDFKEQAEIYISEYEKGVKECKLQIGAKEALSKLVHSGITNSVLTAGQEEMALDHLKYYGIEEYFIAVTGKKDFYASGKSELIGEHLEKIDYSPEEMVFVGDTLHDIEVADKIGCEHLIVMNGHQDICDNGEISVNCAINLEDVVSKIIQ